MSASFASSLAKLAGRPYADAASDRELIARFHQHRDESAFAALVQKHGPMVLGACQRKLRDRHAADDAYQATFLILAKKAGAVNWHESLSGWLYRVAMHVCSKALTKLAKQKAVPLLDEADLAVAERPTPSELSASLDEALSSLPATYRDPLLLCHLQGETVEAAAKSLGLSEGQLRGRLFRAREKLRTMLAKKGVVLSLTALIVGLTATSAQAVPPVLQSATLALALGGSVSPSIQILVHGGLSAMSATKLKLLAASFALVLGLGTAGVAIRPVAAQAPETNPTKAAAPLPAAKEEPKPEAEKPAEDDDQAKEEQMIDRRDGKLKSIDAAKNQLVVTLESDKFDLTVDLDAKSEIIVAKRNYKLADLAVGMDVAVSFRGKEKTAFRVDASWPHLETTVKAVDAAKRTLSISARGNGGFEFEVPLSLASDANIVIDGLPAGLGDLTIGKKLRVEFGPDKKTAYKIEAEADSDELSAAFVKADAKSLTLLLRIAGHRDERKIELNFPIASTAKFHLAGKDIAIADLKEKMPVRVKFDADRRTVTGVWAGPVPEKGEEGNDEDDDGVR